MVDYNEWMQIGLDKCGSSESTFGDLAQLWSQNKDEIEGMTRSEARDCINCP